MKQPFSVAQQKLLLTFETVESSLISSRIDFLAQIEQNKNYRFFILVYLFRSFNRTIFTNYQQPKSEW